MYFDQLKLSIRLDEGKNKSILFGDKFDTKYREYYILLTTTSKLINIPKLLNQVASMMKPWQGNRWHYMFLTKSTLDKTEL